MGWCLCGHVCCEGVCTWLKSFEYRIFGNIGFGGKCEEQGPLGTPEREDKDFSVHAMKAYWEWRCSSTHS